MDVCTSPSLPLSSSPHSSTRLWCPRVPLHIRWVGSRPSAVGSIAYQLRPTEATLGHMEANGWLRSGQGWLIYEPRERRLLLWPQLASPIMMAPCLGHSRSLRHQDQAVDGASMCGSSQLIPPYSGWAWPRAAVARRCLGAFPSLPGSAPAPSLSGPSKLWRR